jgi:hypothetical protein
MEDRVSLSTEYTRTIERAQWRVEEFDGCVEVIDERNDSEHEKLFDCDLKTLFHRPRRPDNGSRALTLGRLNRWHARGRPASNSDAWARDFPSQYSFFIRVLLQGHAHPAALSADCLAGQIIFI